MDKFIAQQRLLYPLSDESVLKLTEGMEEVFAPKGSFPVYEGDRDPYVWFVKEGLARSFVERDMRDVTLWFVSSGEIVNMSYRETAAYNLEMVEDTVLLRIPARRLKSFVNRRSIWRTGCVSCRIITSVNMRITLSMTVGVMPVSNTRPCCVRARTFSNGSVEAYCFIPANYPAVA